MQLLTLEYYYNTSTLATRPKVYLYNRAVIIRCGVVIRWEPCRQRLRLSRQPTERKTGWTRTGLTCLQ